MPPLSGTDAVKVTDVPEQIVVAEALMDTLGVTSGFTAIVIVLLVAVPVEQGREEVRTTQILSEFVRAALV